MAKSVTLISRWYRRKFSRSKKTYFANIYFEPAAFPSDKVHMFGEFSKTPWEEMVECKYDPYFKCFKSPVVKIKDGHKFKFMINQGQQFQTS